MMMSVHQSRQHHLAAKIKDLVGRPGQLSGAPHSLNEVIPNENATVSYFAPVLVHGDDDSCVAQK
jgi:hypothetical protein